MNASMPFSRALEPAVSSDVWPRPAIAGHRPLAGGGASRRPKGVSKDAPTNKRKVLIELHSSLRIVGWLEINATSRRLAWVVAMMSILSRISGGNSSSLLAFATAKTFSSRSR